MVRQKTRLKPGFFVKDFNYLFTSTFSFNKFINLMADFSPIASIRSAGIVIPGDILMVSETGLSRKLPNCSEVFWTNSGSLIFVPIKGSVDLI